jgi:hypothetical protein
VRLSWSKVRSTTSQQICSYIRASSWSSFLVQVRMCSTGDFHQQFPPLLRVGREREFDRYLSCVGTWGRVSICKVNLKQICSLMVSQPLIAMGYCWSCRTITTLEHSQQCCASSGSTLLYAMCSGWHPVLWSFSEIYRMVNCSLVTFKVERSKTSSARDLELSKDVTYSQLQNKILI